MNLNILYLILTLALGLSQVNAQEYGLKTATVQYKGGEFLGHCRVTFETEDGSEIVVIDPDLGKFKSEDQCKIIDQAADKEFKITYQLQSTEFYIEDIGKQTAEVFVLKSIGLTNEDEQRQFFEELEEQKNKAKNQELISVIEANGGLPARKEFDCDYCNEMKSKGLNACSNSEAKKAVINMYWYSVYIPGGGRPLEYNAEYVFFENGNLLIYRKDGTFEVVKYTMKVCESKYKNGKDRKAVVVRYTPKNALGSSIFGNSAERVAYMYEYNAAMLGNLRVGPKDQSMLEKIMNQ